MSERLKRARLEMGLTQGEVAKYVGVTYPFYNSVETGRTVPRANNGDWKLIAKRLAAFFCVTPSEMFGDGPNGVESCDAVLFQSEFSRESAADLSSESERKEWKRVLDEALKKLTPREEAILRMRFGLYEKPCNGKTYREIAKEFSLTRARVQQIEAGVLRQFRKGRILEFKRLLDFNSKVDEKVFCLCGDCGEYTTYEVRSCETCGKVVCPVCWPCDGNLCRACVKLRNKEIARQREIERLERERQKEIERERKILEELKQAKIERGKLKERLRRTKLALEKERRERKETRQQRAKRELDEVRERARTGKGFLPQNVEGMLEAYFKKLEMRKRGQHDK